MCVLRRIWKDDGDQTVRAAESTAVDRLSSAVYNRRLKTTWPRLGLFIVLFALTPVRPYAQPQSSKAAPPALAEASLEDLMNIKVTSVSKKEQPLSQVAAAIYVITQDDIRHSGMNDVPDLLRMVPGVEVARITANAWAISIRGFNSRYSGKVLVVVDGRAVYTPLFSGVFWDQQTMPLENIERIEVIRGPGGTVWGANAMNGVINIITKNSDATHGGLTGVETGSQGSDQALAQYGGPVGTNGSYRIYGRYTMNGNSPSIAGSPAADEGHESQVGFRSDLDLSTSDNATVQGDVLGASESQTITTLFSNAAPVYHTFDDRVQVAAGNILGRWTHVFSDGSETTLQTSYDRSRRFDQGLAVLNTVDVSFQYHFSIGARNDIVAGLGYRLTDQNFKNGYEVSFDTSGRRDNLFSAFIQDAIRLDRSWTVTAGSKFEHNAYTGFEFEPSLQFAYTPNERQTAWASVSRAIQQPSWVYADAQVDAAAVPLPGGGVGIYHISGNPRGTSPRMLDYEIGYRAELSKQFTLDTSVFLSDYRSLQTVEPQAPYFSQLAGQPYLILPNVFGNLGNARDYGVEFSARWNVTGWWRISPGFSFLQMDVSQDASSRDTTFAATPGDNPKRQAQLRSDMNLRHNLEWDTSVYQVGSLATGLVPAYTRLDTRLGWRLGKSLEVSVAGQNLLTPRHLEFFDARQVIPMLVGRGGTARITWRF
jgi:iron complex outermembrane recepter protein